MCYNRKRVIWLLCGALIALATCFFQYRYDNKYNFPGPRAREGVLDLSQHAGNLTAMNRFLSTWDSMEVLKAQTGLDHLTAAPPTG